jgi:PAS domain S-box-containing protein
LQSGSLDGIWYWDLENPENEWMSRRFWTLLGHDPEKKKHLASEWQHLIHPKDLQVALKNFERRCEYPNHPYDQVVRYRHKDGSTVWVRCRGIAIRDKTGKPIRMLGAHTNLTQQKAVEERLRDSEANLKLLTEHSADVIYRIDINFICNDQGYWNQIESYIESHSDASFSHGLCSECVEKLYGDQDWYKKRRHMRNH